LTKGRDNIKAIDDGDVVVSATGINRIKFPRFSQEVLYAKFLSRFGRRTRLDNG